MKMSLPYPYVIDHVDRNERKVRHPQIGMLECDIPEARPVDLEVVARWRFGNVGPARRDRREMRTEVAYVEWNGSLYLPTLNAIRTRQVTLGDLLSPVRDVQVLHLAEFGQVYAGILRSVEHGDSDRETLLERYIDAGRPFKGPTGGEIVASTEERDRNVAEAIADGMILVDGDVWQKATHVHASVSFDSDDDGTWCGTLDIDYSKDGGKTFRHDRRNAWQGPINVRMPLSDIGRLESYVGDTPGRRIEAVEIFEPSLVAFDGRSEYLASAVETLLSVTQADIQEYPAEDVSRWLTMREGLEAYLPRRELPMDEAVAEAFLSFKCRDATSTAIVDSAGIGLMFYDGVPGMDSAPVDRGPVIPERGLR